MELNEWGQDLKMLLQPIDAPRHVYGPNGLGRVISDALFTPMIDSLQIDPHAVMALDGSPDSARVMVRNKKNIVIVSLLDPIAPQHVDDVLNRFRSSLSRHYFGVKYLSHSGSNHYFLVNSQ